MSTTVRTFIAVAIPPEVQQQIGRLLEKLRLTTAKVKWVDPHQMHWTLKFLGEIDMREVPELCQRVSEAVAEVAPFDVEAIGAGAFPTVQRPRTVWVGMGMGSEEMIDLHGRIEHALKPLGFRPEGRRFRPHVTIGRVRQSADASIRELGALLEQHAQFDGGLSSVFDVTIFSSELGRSGPTYEALGHAELKGRE